jgi:hypothetical protein
MKRSPEAMTSDRSQPYKNKALVGLCMMCLSTSLFYAFRSSLPYDMYSAGRAGFSFLASIPLSVLWICGLVTWKENLKHISEEGCDKSMIGGLIAANLGLLYISSYLDLYLESKLSYVAGLAHLGMLLGFWGA